MAERTAGGGAERSCAGRLLGGIQRPLQRQHTQPPATPQLARVVGGRYEQDCLCLFRETTHPLEKRALDAGADRDRGEQRLGTGQLRLAQ